MSFSVDRDGRGLGGVDGEILRYLPDRFVDEYMGLVVAVYGGSAGVRGSGGVGGGSGGSGDVGRSAVVGVGVGGWRVSSSQVSGRGGAKRSGKGVELGIDLIPRLLVVKENVDAKLRKAAKFIETGGDSRPVRKCTSCYRFAESTWNWCPWCRGRTEEIDE